MSILLENIYCKSYLKKEYGFVMKKIHITKSIPYLTLTTGDFSLYEEFVKSTRQDEHTVKNFKFLINNFDCNIMKKINVYYQKKEMNYIVADGVHRLSLLIYKKIISDCVPLTLLNIRYDKMIIKLFTKFLNKVDNVRNKKYYSFNICNFKFKGKNSPRDKITSLRKYINFKRKNILNIGCNTGGILLHLPEIKLGIGIDSDEKCIDSANIIKNSIKYNNQLIFTKGDLTDLKLLSYEWIDKYDIIFISERVNIENWEKLFNYCIKKGKKIIYEENNSDNIKKLAFFIAKKCKIHVNLRKNEYDGNVSNVFIIKTI